MTAGDSPFSRKPAVPGIAPRTAAGAPARPNAAPNSTLNSAPSLAAMAAAAAASALSASGEREFELTQADFERIRKLIYDHAGIVLSPAKQDMVYSRLARRLRACGDRSFAQYIVRLERDRAEWETFVNSLTTNLTSFFREAHHFDMLAERMRRVTERRTIRIWCNAASTGEEPYSLAITACEAFNTLSPPVQIIASDIDTSVLAHAERGVYRDDRVGRMAPDMLRRYFEQGAGLAAGEHRVRPELKRLLSFRRINLLDPVWSVQGPLDAIFCRNVMIYFDKTTQYAILKRFVPLLRKDGALFAGHSESFMHAGELFRSTGRTVYQRTDADRD